MDELNEGKHSGKGPKNYKRSEEKIKEDVNERLSEDPYVDASEIEVEVNGTEVTLTGTVDSKQARRRAEDLADRVSGVTHVQNNIRCTTSADQSFGSTGSDSLRETGSSRSTSGTTTNGSRAGREHLQN